MGLVTARLEDVLAEHLGVVPADAARLRCAGCGAETSITNAAHLADVVRGWLAEQRLLAAILRDYTPGDGHSWDTEFEHLRAEHPEHIARLTVDIARDGQREPILLGNDGRIWDGHHRLAVLSALGSTWVKAEDR